LNETETPATVFLVLLSAAQVEVSWPSYSTGGATSQKQLKGCDRSIYRDESSGQEISGLGNFARSRV